MSLRAGDLGSDLEVIDLSRPQSKYPGKSTCHRHSTGHRGSLEDFARPCLVNYLCSLDGPASLQTPFPTLPGFTSGPLVVALPSEAAPRLKVLLSHWLLVRRPAGQFVQPLRVAGKRQACISLHTLGQTKSKRALCQANKPNGGKAAEAAAGKGFL